VHAFTGQQQGTVLGWQHGSVIPQTTSQSQFSEWMMAKDSSWRLNIALGMEAIQRSEPFDKGGELEGAHATFNA
jgi:hypothetical protein